MKLPFETWGKGPTRALLLHGFTGSRASWRHLEPLLGDVLTATAVDLPGHAGAPLPSTEGAEGFLETVDSLAELLERPTVIIGYSQGSRLALALAARHPEKVERLVLESGSAGLRRRRDRVLRRASDQALAQVLTEQGVDAFITKWEALPLFAGLRALPAAEQAALRARRVAHTAEGLVGALTSLGQGAQPDYWPALIRVLRPTLVLSGALDTKYTRLARKMIVDLPLAWRRTFRQVGHAPHLECPTDYANEVRSFLAPAWRGEPAEMVP
jgi:2-succinyl-6-hydroxy-2,4-cyclohexadiene-1-carboxylate synthase